MTTSPSMTTAIPKPLASVLILHSLPDSIGEHVPVITDSSGRAEYAGKDFDFSFGPKTKVSNSCSITYRGNFYVFGGSSKRQISKVIDCSLKRVGTLSFNFEYGACTTVNEDVIYLCFDKDHTKQCFAGADPVGSFTKITRSNFDHRATRISSNEGSFEPFN